MGGGTSKPKKIPPPQAADGGIGNEATIPNSSASPAPEASTSPGAPTSPESPDATSGVPSGSGSPLVPLETSGTPLSSAAVAPLASAESLIGWAPPGRMVIHLDSDRPGDPMYSNPAGTRETQEERSVRLRTAQDTNDWSSLAAIDDVADMFGSAVEEMRAMKCRSDAVSSMYTSKLPREGCTADELKVRDGGLAGKPAAAAYLLQGITPLEVLEREYAKLAPLSATHTMAPLPAAPVGRVVVLEVPGKGGTSAEDGGRGHRADTVPILNACVAAGFATVPRFYMDASAAAVAQECARADAVIVRVPTDEDVPGVTLDTLRAMLASVNKASGTVILPNIATADAMNRKDAVVRLAQHAVRARAAGGSDPGLASVARDTVAYASVSAFRQSFPASLARASATASSHWSMDASSAIPVQSGAAAARGERRETGKRTNVMRGGCLSKADARRVLKQDRDVARAGSGDGSGVWSVGLLSANRMDRLRQAQEEEALAVGQTLEYSLGPNGNGVGPLGAMMRKAAVAYGGGQGRMGVAGWQVQEALAADAGLVTVDAIVECQHALDNQVQQFTLGHFMRNFEVYLSQPGPVSKVGVGGQERYLVDAAYLPAVSTRGEVRVDYVFDTPIEVTVKLPAAGGMSSAVASGAAHRHAGLDQPQYRALLESFGKCDIHRMMLALGLPPGSPLPIFWSVDFISRGAGEGSGVGIEAAAAGSNPKASTAAADAGLDPAHGFVVTGLSCAVSKGVIHGLAAVDPGRLASSVSRALEALVPLPYARAKAQAAEDVGRDGGGERGV